MNFSASKGKKHQPLGWPAVLTVHPDPALLLAHGLQQDPIQHASSHGPADWDDRFQLLRRQRRVGLQPGEHLRPGQRLRGSSGRRGELHGAPEGQGGGGAGARLRALPAGRGGRERSGGGQAPERQPAPTRLTSFPAAHCPRLGRCSPPAASGRDPGREADPAWPRPGVGPGSGVGPSREGTWKDPGGAARPPAPAEPPRSALAGVSRGQTALGLGMQWGRAGQGWGRRRQGPPPLTGSRRRRRLRGSEGPLPRGRGAVAPGSRPPVLGPHPRNEPARPLTLRPRLAPRLRLRLRHRSHKPGSRGGGGGRRHPRVIGRSNRGPRARPRVQSSNEAEEELPPKAGKIGHRAIHPAGPAFLPKTLSAPGRPAARGAGPASCCGKWGRRGEAGKKRGAGNLKREEKSFPSPLPTPFPSCSYFCIHLFGPTFLSYWRKRLERLLYFTVAVGGTPPSFPETRLGNGVWIVGSALCALSAPKLDLSSV